MWNSLQGLHFLPHSLTNIPLADNKPLVPDAFSLAFGTKFRGAGLSPIAGSKREGSYLEQGDGGGLYLRQVFGEDQKIISRRIEIVDDRLTGIATGFIEPARRGISWSSGRFYQ